jgi:Tfp pilus assembly protein PilV
MAGIRLSATQMKTDDGFGIVEALIALTILVIGVLAVSGLTLASAAQARIADWQADQATAGQLALEEVQRQGFAAAASGADTVTISGHDFVVTLTVTSLTPRVKQVQAQVAGVGDLSAQTFTTRLYRVRSLPAP